MDRVRFGRALGYGARHAAKAMMAAADAATAPGTTQKSQSTSQPQARPTPRPAPVSAARVAAVSAQAAAASGRGMASSVKRFSGSVLLQVIGTFFALFAVSFATGAWRLKAAFHGPSDTPEAHRLYTLLLMAAVFGYFTISSFVRARKLEKS